MSETFEIEKNVPIPKNMGNTGTPPLYPFAEMEVGDSFFMPVPADMKFSIISARISNAASCYRRKNKSPKKFATRRTVTGIRCWRIA